ncbi:MAG: glutamate synthase subunit beta [Anaerolineae bacterium]|nr:glutamate synthase subunit beta [Anaerolineae bacterium]
MGDPRGFINVSRIESGYRPVEERISDYDEVERRLPDEQRRLQASRCMDCGVPFCHWGCPVGSLIPEWHAKLHQGDWKAAYDILQKTNNFPEFTGRLCPAPCESACVVGIHDSPLTIRENELAIIDRAFAEGYVRPQPPHHRTGKHVAVVGSGPAGLACADSLNKMGHSVVLYEAADAVGGYLRYGVPDFKFDKHIIDRRVTIMQQEGLTIKTGVRVGADLSVDNLPVDQLRAGVDAVVLAIGAREPRDLPVEGRDLDGIHFAVNYLTQQNRAVRGDRILPHDRIMAQGKHVVVIGGGDTGADCVGTANRQGAISVTQIELLPALPESRAPDQPWPLFARVYKTSSSHAEGCERLFNISTQHFIGENGRVKRLSAVQVDWQQDSSGRHHMYDVPGSQFELEADLVLLAMGFVHVEHGGPVAGLGIDLDQRGNIAIDERYQTSVNGVFAAGDATRGPSLVVWAILDGRAMAQAVHEYLQG